MEGRRVRGLARWAAGLVAAGTVAGALVTGGPAYADATRDQQWMIDALHLPEAWRITRGEGAVVGIVDTGVDATHPDLAGNVVGGRDSWSPAGDGRTDTTGHGTSMASLIVGHGHGAGNTDGVMGVAPEAKLLSYGAMPPQRVGSGPGKGYDNAELAKGIRWLVDNGAQVILLAYGGGSPSQGESEAIEYAKAKGVPVAAPAGNTADGDDYLVYPASRPEVVSVSGIGPDGTFSDSSARGTGIEVSSPCVDIVSADRGGGYGTNTGTSDASAIVAGALALLKSHWPDISREDMMRRLFATAADRGESGPDDLYGYGVIDPVKALTDPNVQLVDPSKSPHERSSAPPAASGSDVAATGSTKTSGAWWWIGGAAAVVVMVAAIALIAWRRRSATGG